MIREEYEGENSEIYSSRVQEQINFNAHSCSTGDRAYQPTDKSNKPIYIIDEDSYSLVAKPTIIDEGFLSLWTNPSTRQSSPRIRLFNFNSLRKLQI